MKISHYLIKRLEEIGVKHVFGIPGDYILSFFEDLAKSPLELIGTCNELNAGYAADAYARLNGISCAAVTYGVGAFSILNAVAGAYAERVPLILISGAPSTKREGHLLHHTAKDRTLQFEIFKRVTEKAVILNDITAPKLIDEAITTCYLTKRPVYIELPIDIVSLSCQEPSPLVLQEKKSDEKALSQAIQKTKELLASAKDPCCLLGIEVQRFHLEKLAETFLKNSGLSFATTLLGKSVLPESHPQFIGVYSGALVTKDIIDRVENSDLCLGTLMTDINLGLYSSKLDPSKMILAAEESVRIGRHIYKNVLLKDFLYGLSQNPRMFTSTPFVHPAKSLPPFKAQKVKLTHKRFYHCIQKFLKNDHMLLVDTGDAMLSACDLLLPDHIPYIAEAFYRAI